MTQAMEYDFQRFVLEHLDKTDRDISGVGTVMLLAPVLQVIASTIRAFLGRTA